MLPLKIVFFKKLMTWENTIKYSGGREDTKQILTLLKNKFI